MQIVAYLRVSTERQGESGLGIEAQRDYIAKLDRLSRDVEHSATDMLKTALSKP